MEHFESHGDHWNALGFEDQEIMEKIQESIQKGILENKYVYEYGNTTKILPFLYPESNPIQFCSLVVSENNKNTAESFFPILEGIKNSITIESKYIWKNDLVGEIEIFRDSKFNLSFFAPFYHQNFSTFSEGSKAEIYLSGLAYFIEKAVMEYEIDKGDMYELALGNFLKDNPKKSKKDFPFVILDMSGSIIVFPTNICSEFEYRGPILEIEDVTFFGKTVKKAKISLEKNDPENSLFINLYFSEKNVRDCEVKIGTEIMCRLWLMGYM